MEPTDKLEVMPPPIVVNEAEVEGILNDLDLIQINPPAGEEGKVQGISIKKQIRLGIFSESIGGVRIRSGALLLSEQIALRHLQRLDSIASNMVNAADLKDMAYPIGFLHKQLSSSASKSKIVVDYVPMEQKKEGSESWEPGSKVLPPIKVA